MSYAYRKADLFKAGWREEQAIAHGCNCRGAMGAGVAAIVAKAYGSRMVAEYQRRCRSGDFSPGGVMTWDEPEWFDPKPLLYNLATQDFPGADAQIDLVYESVARMLQDAEGHEIERIGIPQIGCGIGGLQWKEVDSVLQRLAMRSPVRLTVYLLKKPVSSSASKRSRSAPSLR